LTDAAPPALSHADIVYDPANPAPTLGGDNLEIQCGPIDQRPLEARADVRVFTGPVLKEPLALSGPLVADVLFSTNVTDTDVTVSMMDVYPDGRAILIADGIVRARWRLFPSTNLPSPLSGNPADVYHARVSLWNTTYVFPPGHAVRLHVSSSNWPRFMPNKNTGVPMSAYDGSPNVTAGTAFWMGGGPTASSITLPVVSFPGALPAFPVEALADAPRYAPLLARLVAMGSAREGEGFGDFIVRRMAPIMRRLQRRVIGA